VSFGKATASVVVAIMTVCGSSFAEAAAATNEKAIPPPAGLPSFYAVPQPLPSKAGTLLKSQRVAVEGLHGTVYRVMYVSRSMRNRPVAVTGIVDIPNGPVPAGGYPVVTWGHGTNGMADPCAPSLRPIVAVPAPNALLDRGWVITASDYEGEGTPGLMPYIAGESAARNTIDIVLAARQLGPAHASNRYVVWGHSEGGQTAMFALKIGRSYAPSLRLAGVVAGAPPSQFNLIYDYLKSSRYRYYLLMAAGGLNAAYGDKVAPLDQILTPHGLSLLPSLDQGCSDYLSQRFGTLDVSQYSRADPFTVPSWRKVLIANDPEAFTAARPVPLLMIQGGSDEQIPVVSTQLLATHLCGIGQDLERWIYPGQSHSGVIAPSYPDMTHWIADRFQGAPTPDTYAPVGQSDVQITACPT
jgi:pimeloyl-ACP methyl ester carboxylesterase